MLWKIGGHLQRRVEGDVKSQLVADSVAHLLSPRHDFAHVCLEDAGCVVHRAALQTRERQYRRVAGVDALTEFGAHSALVADHIGPCAAQTGRSYGFVRVDHDVVLGSLHDGIMVVVVDRLAVMALAKRDDGAHVTALHGVVAVLVHQRVGFLHPMLIVDCGGGTFMVHDETDALLMGVFVQSWQIKVRIGGEEVENELFLFAVPVFPADVPAFDEQPVKTVGGSEVDIAAHVGVVGTVCAIWRGVFKVGLAQFHRGKIVGVIPGALAGNHLPPHTHVLHGMNPRHILQGTRLVEVEDEARGQYIGGFFAYHHGAPRGDAWCLDAAFVAGGVGTQPCTEGVGF